ncbi:MAG: M50 family metallopeptidase [Acaryochloridaceae cyanobacterium CSU_5_19]|nr:M50 family metallopeptidase [Acaryochloridaceae cyanobacterium CSU_5_19]
MPYGRPLAYSLLLGMGIALAMAIDQNVLVIHQPMPGQVGWAILFFMISLLMHELGHASACVRYGGRPSEIGFTVYLLWPAFYSDVSDAWRLKRWQRVVVDLGGVFFQLAVAAVYVFLYQQTGWQAYQIALALIIGSCLMTLNPVFKFDGYWVFADAFGITNLSQQPSRIIAYYLQRCGGDRFSLCPGPQALWWC